MRAIRIHNRVLFGLLGAVLLATATAPVLGVIGLGVGAVLAFDWFMFRARRGMRF